MLWRIHRQWELLKLRCIHYTKLCNYSLFKFSWPRFESGSLRNGGMLILRIFFAVDGMPIEMCSVGRGLRVEVYVMVECSYFAYSSRLTVCP